MEIPLKVDFQAFSENNSSSRSSYELLGLVTHIGRSADSGHYVAWVNRGGHWYKCDDEKIQQIQETDIGNLSGGGDWHIAYYCLFKKVEIE